MPDSAILFKNPNSNITGVGVNASHELQYFEKENCKQANKSHLLNGSINILINIVK